MLNYSVYDKFGSVELSEVQTAAGAGAAAAVSRTLTHTLFQGVAF